MDCIEFVFRMCYNSHMNARRTRSPFPLKGSVMKRQLITVLLAALLLTGCAPAQLPVNTTVPDYTTVATTTHAVEDPLPPIQNPEFPGSLHSGIGRYTTQQTYTENDDVIMRVSMTLPVASIVGDKSLQTTLESRLAVIESQIENEVDELYKRYLSDYRDGREGIAVPSVVVRFQLNYFTTEALSLTYIFSETTWDGLMYTHLYHSNLDLRVGSSMMLSSLMKDKPQIAMEMLISTALATQSIDGVYSNAAQIILENLDRSWHISPGELHLHVEPGVIAPLSSGEVILVFSEEQLEHLLSDYGKALICTTPSAQSSTD